MNGLANLYFSDRAVLGIVKLRIPRTAFAIVGRDANLHDLSQGNLL